MVKIKRKINKKVIFYSLLAIVSLVLTFTLDWIFIVPAAVLMWLNQRQLIGCQIN